MNFAQTSKTEIHHVQISMEISRFSQGRKEGPVKYCIRRGSSPVIIAVLRKEDDFKPAWRTSFAVSTEALCASQRNSQDLAEVIASISSLHTRGTNSLHCRAESLYHDTRSAYFLINSLLQFKAAAWSSSFGFVHFLPRTP